MSTARMSPPRTRTGPLARRFVALFLTLHGFAHLVGAQDAWDSAGAGTAVEYLWGSWTISATALLWVLAAAWAATAVAYAHAAWLLWDLRGGWLRALAIATTVSLMLSLLAMPLAVAGVVIDVILLAAVVAARPASGRRAPRAVLRRH